jgi:IMP cyclohydrolase
MASSTNNNLEFFICIIILSNTTISRNQSSTQPHAEDLQFNISSQHTMSLTIFILMKYSNTQLTNTILPPIHSTEATLNLVIDTNILINKVTNIVTSQTLSTDPNILSSAIYLKPNRKSQSYQDSNFSNLYSVNILPTTNQ